MESPPLDAPVASLLLRAQTQWQELRLDLLDSAELKALHDLLAAGLIEVRHRLKLSLLGQPLQFEATLAASGENGLSEALRSLVAQLYSDWQAAYEAWKTGPDPEASPFLCQDLEESRWRLTAEGLLAQQDLANGNTQCVTDFVTRRGLFVDRPPVHGEGRLLDYVRSSPEAALAPVEIANWHRGAEAFGQIFGQLFERHREAQAASGPQPSPARREGRSEEVAEKLRRFLSRHQPQYQELVQGVLQGDDQARKAFRQQFGPTAFAEAVCGKDLEEVRRVKTAVQQTREYRTLIKPVLSGQPPIDGRDRSGDDPAEQVAQLLRSQCPER